MAGIWNVQGIYNTNFKKVSSKLNFELGDNFYGRISSAKGSNNEEVIVKTSDGWQFPAVLDKPFLNSNDGMVKLQVVGYEAGKIKLKIMTAGEKEDSDQEESLMKVISENGMDKDDLDLLKSMVKHSMPLTRENISNVKTLIDFIEKVKSDSGEEEAFISKYLNGKNISPDSIKGKEVTKILKSFISELKNLKPEDLLTLMENNIEFTPENIESYIHLVKDTNGLDKSFVKVNQFLKSDEFLLKQAEELNKSEVELNVKHLLSINMPKDNEVLESLKKAVFDYTGIKLSSNSDIKVIQEKISDILKNINSSSGGEELKKALITQKSTEIIDEMKKLLDNSPILQKKDYSNILNRVYDNLFNKDSRYKNFEDIIKVSLKNENNNLNQSNSLLEKDEAFGKIGQVSLPSMSSIYTKNTEQRNKDIILGMLDNLINEDELQYKEADFSSMIQNELSGNNNDIEAFALKYLSNKNISPESTRGIQIRGVAKEFINELKKLEPKDLVTFLDKVDNYIKSDKFSNDRKNSLVDIKEFNTNAGENADGLEIESFSYQVKAEGKSRHDILNILNDLIGKDEVNNKGSNAFKDNSSDNNVQKIKEKLIEILDGEKYYITSEDYNKNIQKINDMDVKSLINKLNNLMQETNSNSSKMNTKDVPNELKQIIQEVIGTNADINEKNIKEILKLAINEKNIQNSTKAEIINQIEKKTEEIKNMLSELSKVKDELGGESFSRIMNNVKSSINDFKVYNTISEQYYYTDVPLNFNNNQYPCRIIIKDDRKKGKKIDSRNVSMALSVKTVNIGTVDTYIKVRDKRLNIQMNCEKKWVKLLDQGKEKLLNVLSSSGYAVQISFSERAKPLDLSNCREFFAEYNSANLNVRV